LVAFLVAGAGIAYDLAGGVRILSSAAFWAPIGLGLGLLAAIVRELNRNTVTVISNLGKHRGYTVLGAAPELTDRSLRELPPDKRSPFGCTAFQPSSLFATAFRDLQGVLREDQLVAFIAPSQNEGATTAALCTAVAAAQQGRRVIVVDCDTRRRSLTKELGSNPNAGITECCEAPQNWRSFIEEEPETGLHLMPAARMSNPWKTLVASSNGLAALIGALREHYDLVILDCPPALRSGEGPILASYADKAVAVAAWDQTPISAIRQTVRTLQNRAGVRTAIYVNRVSPGFRFGRLRPD
jgi:Mrp family chromosome partitioning ATPase